MEVLIAVIGLLLFTYSVTNFNISDESVNDFSTRIKEEDFDFFGAVKYGEKFNSVAAMRKRLSTGLIAFLLAGVFIMTNGVSAVGILGGFGFAYFAFKYEYINVKSYYKKYITYIDGLLPYYLKQLEIMCQNYTVPVALSRSIEDAPEPFKDGIRDLVREIDAGDPSIDPYVRFAKKFPVKDSMRMMRLLYRLSLGSQENKHQQLVMFSRSVSSLQNKAREDGYRARLEKFEAKTRTMLLVTGGITLILLGVAMYFMLSNFV